MTFSLRMLLSAALDVYVLAIVAYLVFRWLSPEHRRYRIYAFLAMVVEPVLRPIRRVLPPIAGLDFSPAVAILLLEWLGRA